MLVNIQGFTPNASSCQKWKHDYLSSLIDFSNVKYLVIAMTETWLKPFMTDAQIHLNDFTVFRADRQTRVRGGALLYIHNSIPITSWEIYDDGICEAVFCVSTPSKVMFSCVYKPCDAPHLSFSNMLQFLETCFEKITDSYKFTNIVLGDLNFPSLWTTYSNDLTAVTTSEIKLLNFLDNHFLSQYIDIATRENNILDLFLTNNENLVHHVQGEKHMYFSDHNVIDILVPKSSLLPSSNVSQVVSKEPTNLQGFRALNLLKADFIEISNTLCSIDWKSLWATSSLEEFPELLNKTILEVCKKHAPPKQPSSPAKKSPHDRSYHTLLRKKRKLKTRLNCIKSINPLSPLLKKLDFRISKLVESMKLLSFTKQETRERHAISKIKSNPKFFYSYSKKLSKTKVNISQLFDSDGNLTTDRKDIANILQKQFQSSFSNPNNPDKIIPPPENRHCTLSDFTFSRDDIVRATDEIDPSSSCPDFSLPAIVLKKCKTALAIPLELMWNESLKFGIIPAFYKKQIITPVFKKGSRTSASNYRPISLTAHEVKIFERIIRDKIMEFLESQHLLSSNQHGFRKGKSCLTQLLQHYDNIIKNLLNNNETDTIYLDYAKAFDKVDHSILIQKLKNIGICGKLCQWVENFLSDRTQVVVVNDVFSFIVKVLSGVPQGTVHGPLLFLIFANDLENYVNSSTMSSFADDTRISMPISISSDSQYLQSDLFSITSWSSSNNMKLHEDKFVYLNFNTRSTKFPLANLPFFNDYFTYATTEGKLLEPSDSVSDLGVVLCDNLNCTQLK